MAILLVPYNNAMRLGQGFNSFTQQIRIDDAVVVDPTRAETVVTNDGTTMRIIAEKSARPSVWSRQPEVVMDKRAEATVHRINFTQAMKESEEPEDEQPKVEAGEPTQIGGGITKDAAPKKDANALAATVEGDEEDEGTDDTSDEPLDANDEVLPATESDFKEHITRNKLDKDVSKEAAAKDPDKVEDETSTNKAPDTKSTTTVPEPAKVLPGTLSPGKLTEKSSPIDAGSKPARVPAKRPVQGLTPSQIALQRAAKKPKADATRKTAEEVAQEAIRKMEDAARQKAEAKRIEEQRRYEEELEKERRADERARLAEDRAEQKIIRAENRAFETKLREDARRAIDKATDVTANSIDFLKKIAEQNQFAERFSGMLDNQQQYSFDATGVRGPSQAVSYSSRFVDNLSDVTDDMCVSGSLSIKAGKIGGSGKGSFVNSDKFKESDLNFYISVKVVNQTVNFKDALVYNPVQSVTKDSFKEVFGDSFISGFVEGGEFNAIVSMKILNKAKKTDIQAEAKVALTAGPVDLTAEANVGIARSNLETNTETTIQVSWSGGGHIKPMDQQWNISSLMQAAARFPDLVADCPQRTYAILTKYDTLRSFVALKPQGFIPLQYENAQMYTNALLDSYMSYKALHKQIGEQIFRVKATTLEILPWGKGTEPSPTSAVTVKKGTKDETTGLYPYYEDLTRFDASIKGLSDAIIAIRRQMVRIVNEVDLIEKYPKYATDEDHNDRFQSPNTFEIRLPKVDVPERLKRGTNPLTGRAIKAKELTTKQEEEEVSKEEALSDTPRLYAAGVNLTLAEKKALDKTRDERLSIGLDFRVTAASGSDIEGKWFNHLDIIKAGWLVDSIKLHVYRGFISYIGVTFDNGLLIGNGVKHNDAKSIIFGPFNPGERIISASIETGIRSGEKISRVLAIGLFSNHGRSFLATATTEAKPNNEYSKDGVRFEKVEVTHFDGPIENGTINGFFGYSDDTANNEGAIWRLGLVWGKASGTAASNTVNNPLGLSSIVSVTSDSHSPQSGSLWNTGWKPDDPNMVIRREIGFNTSFSEPPIVVSGIRHLDVHPNTSLVCDSRHVGVTKEKFTGILRTTNTPMFSFDMSWLAIPKTDKHIEMGVYEFIGDEIQPAPQTWTKKVAVVPFAKPFNKAPCRLTWLCNVRNNTNKAAWSAWSTAVTATTQSVTIQAQRLLADGGDFAGIRVGYFCYDPDECPNIQSGYLEGKGVQERGRKKFNKEFKTTPSVFIALRALECGMGKNLGITANAYNVKEDGFDYDVGPFAAEGDHDLREFGYMWIAVA